MQYFLFVKKAFNGLLKVIGICTNAFKKCYGISNICAPKMQNKFDAIKLFAFLLLFLIILSKCENQLIKENRI